MSRFASFLVGMGGGYIKSKDKEYDRERQAKEDAWREEQQGRQRAEWAKADKLTDDLSAAGAQRATMNGTLVEGAGNKVFNQDPTQAALMQQTLSDEAALRDMAPATSGAGTGVVAEGAKTGHQITTGPVDVAKLNAPEEVASRTAAAYRINGRPMEAMNYQSQAAKLADEQRARVKLLEKEGVGEAMSLLRANNPEAAMAAYQKSGDMKLPEGSKFVRVDGIDIFTKKPGKVWSVVAPDGTTVLEDVGGRVAKYLGIEGQLGIDKDIRTAEAAAVKTALEERRVSALEQNADTNAKKLDGLLARGMGGSVVRQGQQGGLNMADVDKQLAPMFTTEDPATGQKKLNTSAYAYVRSLATQMPAAMQGDSIGAALQAAQAYEMALTQAKGDHAKASQILAAAMQPTPAENPSATQTQVSQGKTGVPSQPPKAPSRGIFESPTGEIQLLQPLFNMNQWRKSLQQQTNDNSN